MSDGDVEFLLQLYDTAFVYLTDKQKPDFAENFLYKLMDYGVDVKVNAKEIGEHDEYLDKAVEVVLEEDDWEPEDDWIDTEFEDEWED